MKISVCIDRAEDAFTAFAADFESFVNIYLRIMSFCFHFSIQQT